MPMIRQERPPSLVHPHHDSGKSIPVTAVHPRMLVQATSAPRVDSHSPANRSLPGAESVQTTSDIDT
jgi:hypothetical protein